MTPRSETICPECRQDQHVPIENGQCAQCHDKTYREALTRTDPASQSIVEEYRLTARMVLDQQASG